MEIASREIAYKKKVGTLAGRTVFQIGTKGGLHLLVMTKGAGVETISAAPHPCVARHIAKKRYDDIVFSDLAKSEDIPVAAFEHLLPQFEALTDRLRQIVLR